MIAYHYLVMVNWRGRVKQSTFSLPINLIKEIDLLIDRLGYRPSRSAYVREACPAKIKEYKEGLKGEGGEIKIGREEV